MTSEGPEMIGREILRLDAELSRAEDVGAGRDRRKAARARRDALRWALHAALTADPSRPPGAEVEAFLEALRASEGGTQ
jgi:hypothetical protein